MPQGLKARPAPRRSSHRTRDEEHDSRHHQPDPVERLWASYVLSTHRARDSGASKGSGKYWVRRTILPSANSKMLTS
jgi:hypothetical protein